MPLLESCDAPSISTLADAFCWYPKEASQCEAPPSSLCEAPPIDGASMSVRLCACSTTGRRLGSAGTASIGTDDLVARTTERAASAAQTTDDDRAASVRKLAAASGCPNARRGDAARPCPNGARALRMEVAEQTGGATDAERGWAALHLSGDGSPMYVLVGLLALVALSVAMVLRFDVAQPGGPTLSSQLSVSS